MPALSLPGKWVGPPAVPSSTSLVFDPEDGGGPNLRWAVSAVLASLGVQAVNARPAAPSPSPAIKRRRPRPARISAGRSTHIRIPRVLGVRADPHRAKRIAWFRREGK